MAKRKYKDYHKEIDGILHKRCIDCGEWLEANLDNFGKNKNTKSGLNDRCIECYQKHNHEKYISNKDKYKENIAQRIANNQLYNSQFNDYIIDGDITKIILNNKNGEEIITIIDTEDLERVKSFGLNWGVKYDEHTKTYYARATRWEEINGIPKYTMYYLHILLMNPKNREYIDHKNHDTLNNRRKENLRITTNSNNGKNRKSKNSNNTSGYRNVCRISSKNQWRVQLQIDGKCVRFGDFDDRHEAGKLAEKMRQKYYGEFAGKS